MTLYIQPYALRRTPRRMAASQPQEFRSLRVNIREEEDAYTLYALVPGLKADGLSIQVLENMVSIEGEYTADENDEFLLNELPRGSFRRVLRMPADIEADKVEAKIADGVLTLSLPKAESARPKKIKVAVH
jgi:HSP20 family protein